MAMTINDHDYGFFEYKHWLVGKFMMIDDVDADFLNRLGYLILMATHPLAPRLPYLAKTRQGSGEIMPPQQTNNWSLLQELAGRPHPLQPNTSAGLALDQWHFSKRG